MLEAATTVGKLKNTAPTTGGWSPLFARSFISRLNGFVGEWVQAAGTLQRVLDDDAPDLINVARRYRDAHDQAEAAVDKINK